MKSKAILTTFILLTISFFFIENVSADNEPNNSFNNAEGLGEGITIGTVFTGENYDRDYYVINISRDERLEITVRLTDRGILNLYFYINKTKPEQMESDIIVVFNSTKTVEFPEKDRGQQVYLLIRGDGSYEIDVNIAGENENSHEQWGINIPVVSLIFLILLIAIVVGLIIVIFSRLKNMADEQPVELFDLDKNIK